MNNLIENKEIARVKNNSDLSDSQLKVWNLLENRKFKIKKVISGKNIECNLCGKKSRVENSLFVVIENEKKEEKRIAAGCLKIYFGIELEKRSSRKINL